MRGMGSLRLLASVMLVGLMLAGCGEPSRVDPNAVIHVTGSVHAPNSAAPLVDRPVTLGTGITAGEVGGAMLTAGLSCTSGHCRGHTFTSSTKADGSYDIELKGKDTQSSFGEAVSVLLTTSAAPAPSQVSGASASARFKVQTERVALPDLQLVDPGLALAGETEVKATWSATAPGPYVLTFETADPLPAWQSVAAASPASVDPRLLEDTFGRAVVAGEFSNQIEGSDVQFGWRSPGIGYAAGAGAPPSRGRQCRFVDAAGTIGDPLSACGLTDGKLSDIPDHQMICQPAPATSPSTEPRCAVATAAIVDLGRPVPAQLVVVRGCEGGCAVEASADGRTFVPVGSVSDGFGQVALDARPVTSVRIGLGSGAGLREVSVWGPRPARPALKPLAAGSKHDLRGAFGGDAEGDEGLSRWLLVAAALLTLSVLVAAAYTLGRRRPAPPAPA